MDLMSLARVSAVKREPDASLWIPYTSLADEYALRTRGGDYVQGFRLIGRSFESADDAVVGGWHEHLNVLLRNLASPHVALWTHLIRRRAAGAGLGRARSSVPSASPGTDFAAALCAQYAERLKAERLMTNELYLTLVYRPLPTSGARWAWRAMAAGRSGTGQGVKTSAAQEAAAALDACAKLRELVLTSLAPYEPVALGLYRRRGRAGERWCSALVELLSLLMNGEGRARVLSPTPLGQGLATSRVSFGPELIEYRTATATLWGAMLGIKEYPATTTPGLLDGLLAAPYPLVLTQSLSFLSKAAAQGLLQRQVHRMANAGDFAVSQADALHDALDALTSNAFVMGEHHFTLQVLSDPVEAAALASAGERAPDALRDPQPQIDIDPEGEWPRALQGASSAKAQGIALAQAGLSERIAHARGLLAEAGMTSAREDLALEAAFWSQLPAQWALRPRRAAITSRNFAALAPFHNYPAGRARDNHWGDALTVLATRARTAYHFSLHASDPTDPEGGSRRDTGHTFVCGPTGSGKTVLIGFLVAQLTRCGATQVLIDKDRGLEILTRALGGEYLVLKSGEPTGLNPLALEPAPQNLEFQRAWLASLVARPDRTLAVAEEADLDEALRAVLELPAGARRLSRLIEYLDATSAEGVYARLAPWCEVTGGELAWVFDQALDPVIPRLNGRALIGIDVTEFLSNGAVRVPVTQYLFHLVRLLLDGRRLVCWMDEFWRLIGDPAFAAFAKDGPKTWRKLNAVMCLATQSPSDVLESPLSRTILEQTATKVFFPNPDAQRADYVEGFGLTDREFTLIREALTPGSRRFLVKQGGQSVVCELDLKGFDAALAVISGRASAVNRMNRLRAQVGDDPQQWLPRFLEELSATS
jgi:type IV secretion system protein VirB4